MKYRVLLLDTKPSNPNHYICLGIYGALKKHPDVEFVYKASFGDAVESAKKFKCNLFFAFDGEGLHFEVCKRLKEICRYSILWVTEDPYELHFNLQTMALFDKVFTNDSGSVHAYGEKGFHLPLAATEYIQYHPVCEDEQCLYDVFFAGTAWPNRVDLIRKISSLLDGKIQLKLAMPTNECLPEIKDIPFPLSFYNWRTSNLEFARFANRSRITLGLHRDFAATPGATSKALTPGPRIFEVAMSGGFQLIDQSLAEIDQYFVPNSEIVTFDGQKDCLEKINYFLENPAQRLQIAKAAQDRALIAHCYINRINTIFEVLKREINLQKPLIEKIKNSERSRVLFLTHNIFGKNDWGGIEVYQEILRKNLDSSFEIFFFVPESNLSIKEYSLIDDHQNIVERFIFDDAMMENMLFSRNRELSFSSILMKYNIQLIHVHHFLHHSIGFIHIAKALGIGIIYSWHDYFGMCKNFNLIPIFNEKKSSYCEIEKNSIKQCDLCLGASAKIPTDSQSIRREAFYYALSKVDILHYPSDDIKNRVHSFYGAFNESRQKVLGIPGYFTASDKAFSTNKKLRAVIFGNFTHAKGADLLLEIIKRLNGKFIDIYLYGRIDHLLKESVYTALRDSNNFFYEGAYTSAEDTTLMLSGKDVAIFASNWPETYSIALSEVVNAGLVPIAPNLGAYGDRISTGINGYLYKPNDISELEAIIIQLIDNPVLVQTAKEHLNKLPVMTIDAHIPEITKLYQDLILPFHSSDKKFPIQEFTTQECGVLYNSSVWFGTQIFHLDTTVNEVISIQPSKNLASRIFFFYKKYGLIRSLSRLILGHDQFHSTHGEKMP
jgi:glycosyltransferase involved in cell wall biosynthesis/spore maturation protein CgeB